MPRIKALIVDDEPHARDKIRMHLADHADVDIVGEAGDGQSAVDAILELEPDLLFLDVQMPGIDGFGVLEAIAGEVQPTIIFVTAYDKYAVRAFEFHALDYLLKPFDRSRFDRMLARAVRHSTRETGDGVEERLQSMLAEVRNAGFTTRIVVKTGGRVVFLKTDEISWIEAAANYVKLHVGGEYHLMRETMSNIEARLNPDEFVRVHRSFMVRIDCIHEMQPWTHGEYIIILKDCTQLTTGRAYRSQVSNLLGKSP